MTYHQGISETPLTDCAAESTHWGPRALLMCRPQCTLLMLPTAVALLVTRCLGRAVLSALPVLHTDQVLPLLWGAGPMALMLWLDGMMMMMMIQIRCDSHHESWSMMACSLCALAKFINASCTDITYFVE
jgi:hypothetical protein